MTRIGRMLALGAAPARPGAEPAAMPATNVPWPRSSPLAPGVGELRFTCGYARMPKSTRPGWSPESTIAIVGAAGAGLVEVPHRVATPESYGHIWVEDSAWAVPVLWTGASAVMIRFGFCASFA